MQETKRIQLFDIKSIINDVEKVIQNGLNNLLVNYIDRHELLEKTHEQLIKLPSIAFELNKRNEINLISDSDTNSESVPDDNYSNFTSIKDMTTNIVNERVISFEKRLDKMEKKFDSIIPILDKLVNKITHLNEDIKELQNNKSVKNICDNFEKSSVVKTSENENIEIHIEESSESNILDEDNSDIEDIVNSGIITSQSIKVIKLDSSEPVTNDEVYIKQEFVEEERLPENKEEVDTLIKKENLEEEVGVVEEEVE